jgi:Undecaprenyl-phosphate galactose phosphotransferase WbaP
MVASFSGKAISRSSALSAPAYPSAVNREAQIHTAFKAERTRRSRRWEYLSRGAADIFALCVSAAIAGLISWLISTKVLHTGYHAFGTANMKYRLEVWAALFAGLCTWFAVNGAYSARRPMQDDLKQVVSALIVMLMIDGFLQFASKEEFSRLWIMLVWPVAAITIPILRVAIRRFLDAAGVWRMGAAIIGGGSHCASLAKSLESDRYVGYAIAYHSRMPILSEKSLLQLAASLSGDMRLRGAETVMLVPTAAEMSNIDRTIDVLNLNMTPYTLIPPVQSLPFAGLTVQTILDSEAILMTSRTGLLSPLRQGVKRIFDVVVAAILLVALLPMLLLISVLVASSGGRILYGHKRVGRGNQTFYCLKFRSMALEADRLLADLLARDPEAAREWRQNFKLEIDPRITRVGKFLRKTSLDELPQLLNVLRGEMSLVGPRPVVADELHRYYGENAFYYQMVRPGITGLWQVSGRSQTTYERRVFLDTCYVRNWSLWTDLVILFNTVPSVLAARGAH